MANPPPDELLTADDPAVFAALAHQHYGKLFGVGWAWLHDTEAAEDLAQEVLLRAYLHVHQGNRIQNFTAWCGTVARNLANNWIRSGKRKSNLIEKLAQEAPSMNYNSKSHNPAQQIQSAEDSARLHSALKQLDPHLREIVVLHFIEGCTKSDIARLMNQHPSTISRQLDQALRELRLTLEDASDRLRPLANVGSHAGRAAALVATIGALSASSKAALAAELADTALLASPTAVPASSATSAAGMAGVAKAGFVAALTLPRLLALAAGAGVIATAGVITSRAYKTAKAEPSRPALHVTSIVSESSSSESNAASFGRSHSAAASVKASPTRAVTRAFDMNPVNMLSQIGETTPALRIRSAPLSFRVVNEQGLPVKDAQARTKNYSYSFGTQSNKQTVSSSTPKRGEPVVSDADGSFTLTFNRFAASDSDIKVVVNIQHPDYATTDSEVSLSAVTPIILEAGNALAIRPVMEDGKPAPAPGTHIETGDSAMITTNTWSRRTDGTWIASRVPSGTHYLFAEHVAPDGAAYYSEITSVTLPGHHREPIKVVLHPTFTLHGVLDSAVPRPIVKGKVQVRCNPNVHPLENHNYTTAEWNRAKGLQYGWAAADIAEDGSFTVADLPRADVRLVAGCNGWISSSDTASNSPYGWHARQITYPGEKPVTIPMTQTGSARVHVQAKGGAAITSATVFTYGSINWSPIEVSPDWFGARVEAVSDAAGNALLSNLIPRPSTLNANHPDYNQVFHMGPRDAMTTHPGLIEVQAGKTIEKTVELESAPKGAGGVVSYVYDAPRDSAPKSPVRQTSGPLEIHASFVSRTYDTSRITTAP